MIFWLINDFVRSGIVYLPSGKLGTASQNGEYWSSHAYSNTDNAYNFNFFTSDAKTSSNWRRYSGYSLRCLSTILDR